MNDKTRYNILFNVQYDQTQLRLPHPRIEQLLNHIKPALLLPAKMPGVPPNALSALKTKLKGIFKSKKSKKEDKPVEATKTEEPATNGATATEAAPAEPTPAADAPAVATPAAEPVAEPAKTEVAETPAAPAEPEPAAEVAKPAEPVAA